MTKAPIDLKYAAAISRVARILILTAGFLCFFLQAGWAVGNRSIRGPRVRSPLGRASVPPSQLRSGLFRTPDPIDRSANLVVTGNVGGGRHFRGIVPYNAVTDFGGRLGSTTLDPFLRRSGQFGTYPGGLTPFYSQTQTVTTLTPGSSRIARPPTARLGGSALPLGSAASIERLPPIADARGLRKVPAGLSVEAARRPVPDVRLRPMGMTAQELEQILAARLYQPGKETTPTEKTDEQYQQQVEQFRRDLKSVTEKASLLQQRLKDAEKPLQPTLAKKKIVSVLQPFQTEPLKRQTGPDRQLDIYEQMKLEISMLKQTLEKLQPQEQVSAPAAGQKQQPEEKTQAERLSGAALSTARAEGILGEHKSFASYSTDKFNTYLRVAEDYLKAGKYYKAADAYTLASLYKPDDPLAFAGKSHALFAAGEYMSSALFLARAIQIFPEYTFLRIDIEAMVGDRDTLDSRIADMRQWLEASAAAEMEFLLAYVYYQMGLAEQAKEAIDEAYKKMPTAQAVIALKEAIDEFAANQTK